MQESQVILLTGAAGGMGRTLATVLAESGYRLYLADVDLAALESLAHEQKWEASQVQVRRLDVRDSSAWRALIGEVVVRWGQLDVLINMAGCLQPGLVHALDARAIDTHLDINAKGAMYGSQVAAKQMVAQGRGQIVNIASMAALAPVPGIALYTASKFAIRGFSLALAHELRPLGVAVTVVCPDAVQTPMLDLQLDYPEAALTFSGSQTLTAEDVARAIVCRVLPRRPVEVIMPRWRGWMAKLASLSPGLAQFLLPHLNRRGLARQRHARVRRSQISKDS